MGFLCLLCRPVQEIVYYCKEKNEDEEEDGSDEDEALGRQDDDDSKHDSHAKKHSLGRVLASFYRNHRLV